MFITTENTTQQTSAALAADVRQQRTSFLSALRLTVAAMLFVVGTFLSLGADASEALAAKKKSTAKGKKALVTKRATAKTKAKATTTRKVAAKRASKSKVKALAARAKTKARAVKARTRTSAKKVRKYARAAAKKTARKFSGNFALLNQYKQDLAKYGKEKLEGWQKVMSGEASWYGTFFHGRLTASGRRFNKHADIAAHRSLPFGTILKVTNKDNGKSAIVEVLDRGPYVGDRLIDLSEGTARKLGFMGSGTASVQTEILKVGDLDYKVEAPLTAAELRGDVIKHRIDLTGIDATGSAQPELASLSVFGERSLDSLLPEMKPDMDAFASTNVIDSSQLYAVIGRETTIERA